MQKYEEVLQKQESVKDLFRQCADLEARYEKIIALGKSLPPLDLSKKTPQNLVKGCQSQMYLASELRNGRIYFEAESDALISAGLAAVLLMVYSGQTPETVLMCPPTYLEELNIEASLSPGRSNGLYSIHLRMKQDALNFYIQQSKNI